ncbi:endonuclease domain-containing protein [Actinotalea sp. K2]|uniref:endonuclease domain-containing protein n=1 Tax=Actinotalea sp. K2 TaxID=2939438 RepID=UPI002018350D|nr:DUF559 domain-containing protein [Actinotalea sp. K2]MCL3859412.1 DUF559 domain-containing protein [Actinotalea sp. K2]
MARRPRPLPPELVHGAFTVAEARRYAVGESRVRRSDLVSPLRGVRMVCSGPLTIQDRCRAALSVLPPGSAFTDVTALRLLGAQVPGELDGPDLHVRVTRASPRPQRHGLVVRTSARRVVTTVVGGVPVVLPQEAWIDCAARSTVDSLVVLGDALVRRRRPLLGLGDLEALVGRTPPGTRGLARARTSFVDLREGTDSLMETRTRLRLVRSGLPCPAVNEPVRDSRGQFLAMPDMLYREGRVVIEYDGDVHRSDRAVWMRDIRRRELLQSTGWLVMTVTADDVLRHPDPFVARVRHALRTRCA